MEERSQTGMGAIMKKKRWLLIPLLLIIVAIIWCVSSTQWTRDFDLKYVGYVGENDKGNHSGSSYSVYEITNTTHRTLKDVSVVILIKDDIFDDEWKYEDDVTSSIRPGETVVYKLYRKDYKKVLEELGEDPLFFDVEIVKIKYSR